MAISATLATLSTRMERTIDRSIGKNCVALRRLRRTLSRIARVKRFFLDSQEGLQWLALKKSDG
jgi:hypothetical protein